MKYDDGSARTAPAVLESVREQLLRELRGSERYVPFAAELAAAFGLELEATRDALRAAQDAARWQAASTPGHYALSTPALAKVGAVLVRLPLGTHIPMHGHEQRELTFVLDGTLVENGNQAYCAGSLLEQRPGMRHELVVGGDDECMVMFARA